jgi:serine acetyltransferase
MNTIDYILNKIFVGYEDVKIDLKNFIEYRARIYGEPIVANVTGIVFYKYLIKYFWNNSNGFRDLFYYRVSGGGKRLLIRVFTPSKTCVIGAKMIAKGGIMFHHAFSTYLNAEYIGLGCTFRNNTTIGEKLVNGVTKRPILEDNIFVGPNCVIIGDVTIGHDSIIGAGAVVTKDIPPYSVVAGNPAKIIRTINH